MEQDDKFKVWLYYYDMSKGMAKQFSPMLLSKVVEGVWHVGLVVYGKEYSYGDRIFWSDLGKNPYGKPITSEEIGDTEIPKEVFHDFLEEIEDRFTRMTYDLVNNNCNHFVNECATFLVGKSIPDDIINQAKELLSTPLGKQIMPMVITAQNAWKNKQDSIFGTSQHPSMNVDAVLSMFGLMNSATDSNFSRSNSEKIIPIHSLENLFDKMFSLKLLVIYFWSPAVEAKDEISEIAKEYATEDCHFHSIDITEVLEISFNFDIKKVPCVYIYKHGDLVYNSDNFSKDEIVQIINS